MHTVMEGESFAVDVPVHVPTCETLKTNVGLHNSSGGWREIGLERGVTSLEQLMERKQRPPLAA